MLYPQNDDRIVATDSVTSLRPRYTAATILLILYTLRPTCDRQTDRHRVVHLSRWRGVAPVKLNNS